jgi:hypothetical protein
MAQFVDAHSQEQTVERGQTFDRPTLQQRHDHRIALFAALERAEHEVAHEGPVLAEIGALGHVGQGLRGLVASHFDAIQRLQGQFARQAPVHEPAAASATRPGK